MIRKKLIKSLSLALATMLAIMTVACGAKKDSVSDAANAGVSTTAEEDKLSDSLTKSIGSSDDAGKVETVYVSADASGAANDIIVSEWLKNAGATAELADKTELKDIVNVKGDETFKDNGDGTLTWEAKGSDIYYQGVTDKKLPVNMKITYALDGKEVKPEELAGKSGKVTIRFEYENTDKQTVDVDGKEVEVFTPFVMMSGMILDGDKFSNVDISNGKVISDGGNYIVMGVAVPGLKDSLDISEDKWDELDDEDLEKKLSNSFEITADTTDFELGMTMTMASSDVLSDFGMSDLSNSDKIDDLKDDMNKLNDGSNDLVDGSKELKKGTGKLRDGVSDLYDGTKEFKDGTAELKDGTGKLSDGSKEFYDGLVKYTNGAHDLRNGTAALEEGLKSAKDGSSALRQGMEDANLVDNAKALAQGTEAVNGGVKQLAQMASSLSSLMAASSQLSSIKNAYSVTQAYLIGSRTDATAAAIACQTLGVDKAKLDAIINVGKTALSQVSTGSVPNEPHDAALVMTVGGGELTEPDDASRQASTPEPAQTGDDSDNNLSGGEPSTGTTGENGSGSGTDNPDGGSPATTGNGSGATASGAPATGGSSEGTGNNGVTGTGNQGGSTASTSENAGNPAASTGGSGNQSGANQVSGNGSTAGATQGEVQPVNGNPTGGADAGGANGQNNESISDQLRSNKMAVRQGQGINSAILLGGGNPNQNQNSEKTYTQAELDQKISEALQAKDAELTATKAALETAMGAINTAKQQTPMIAAYAGYLAQTQAVLTFIEKAHLDTLINLDPATLQKIAQLDALVAGADQVANGNAQLAAGIEKLYGGTVQLDQGLGKLKDGSTELRKGADTLTDNNATIVDGAFKLYDGACKLDEGAGKLDDGAGELYDGVGKLYDGTGELDDGVQELVDGVIKFDKEGIKKIYEAFDGDLSDFSDRLSAIEKAGENYSTFGGASDDTDSSVKFIIKTDGIKSENA
ncbi:hypothetical protein [Butyrivibrio hungatei]|uniref:hypothetical protein n=2 Tax=Butyrivibrio TaxID=830 RepID=UPI000414CF9C|nr:hypothetical protein [Butyrivibrio hungatei]